MDQINLAKDRRRIFCAVEFPSEVSARAGAHSKRLRDQFPGVRASWTSEPAFHLTLKFIGEIPATRVEAVTQAAVRATAGVPVFDLAVAGAGVFPKLAAPRVLWLGIADQAGNLARLHAQLETECAREGFSREPRPFHPHLTLARLRQPQEARALTALHLKEQFAAIEIQVTELLVMRSELGQTGSKYSVVSRHPLEKV